MIIVAPSREVPEAASRIEIGTARNANPPVASFCHALPPVKSCPFQHRSFMSGNDLITGQAFRVKARHSPIEVLRRRLDGALESRLAALCLAPKSYNSFPPHSCTIEADESIASRFRNRPGAFCGVQAEGVLYELPAWAL